MMVKEGRGVCVRLWRVVRDDAVLGIGAQRIVILRGITWACASYRWCLSEWYIPPSAELAPDASWPSLWLTSSERLAGF